jgi:hypothetical protein
MAISPTGRSVLRVVLGIVGIAAIVFSAEWASAVVEAFQPGFNEHGTPTAGARLRIAVLGFLGILSALVAALSALAYARTAARKWVTRAVLSSLSAAILFVVWIPLWEHAGGIG